MEDLTLAKLGIACRALAEARSIPEVKEIRDKAAAVQRYMRRKEQSGEAAIAAGELKLRAERRLGELLVEMKQSGERDPGGRGKRIGLHRATQLPDLKIDKSQSRRWQKVASIPPAEFESQLDSSREKLEPATTQQMLRVAKELDRKKSRAANDEIVRDAKPAAAITGKFKCIAIDPPWDWGDEGDVDQLGRATPLYQTMSIEKILDLPVNELAEKNAHIYLWITNRSLPKGFALLERWGFRYVTCLTWCKPSIGMGNYFRGSSEQILFGVRGSLGLLRSDVGTWFTANRSKKHSGKPEEFYRMVEQCSPGPWIEMFARAERPGWTAWGAEVGANA